MNIKKPWILHTLTELNRISSELEKYHEVTPEELAENLSLRWAVEHGLLAGLTLLFQVADHILSTHFGRFPETYEDLLMELHTSGVISNNLYKKLKGSGGFRNILIHEYISIDMKKIASIVQDAPSIFRNFAREILKWLQKNAESQR